MGGVCEVCVNCCRMFIDVMSLVYEVDVVNVDVVIGASSTKGLETVSKLVKD
jgi:hypothetical protein